MSKITASTLEVGKIYTKVDDTLTKDFGARKLIDSSYRRSHDGAIYKLTWANEKGETFIESDVDWDTKYKQLNGFASPSAPSAPPSPPPRTCPNPDCGKKAFRDGSISHDKDCFYFQPLRGEFGNYCTRCGTKADNDGNITHKDKCVNLGKTPLLGGKRKIRNKKSKKSKKIRKRKSIKSRKGKSRKNKKST